MAVGHARRAAGHLQTAGVWPGYQVTYRLNEAYALLGAGAVDEAMRCFDALNETSLPRYLAARLRCLADLTALAAADQRGDWNATRQATLITTLRSLRELEWPSVLPLLPAHIARLFVRALDSGVELDWVRAAIRTRKLPAPLGAPEAWPWSVRVHTLGSFEVTTESGALATRDSRKAASVAAAAPAGGPRPRRDAGGRGGRDTVAWRRPRRPAEASTSRRRACGACSAATPQSVSSTTACG
jgi:hypothetical protein